MNIIDVSKKDYMNFIRYTHSEDDTIKFFPYPIFNNKTNFSEQIYRILRQYGKVNNIVINKILKLYRNENSFMEDYRRDLMNIFKENNKLCMISLLEEKKKSYVNVRNMIGGLDFTKKGKFIKGNRVAGGR